MKNNILICKCEQSNSSTEYRFNLSSLVLTPKSLSYFSVKFSSRKGIIWKIRCRDFVYPVLQTKTGLRMDVLSFEWTSQDGHSIVLRKVKLGAIVSISIRRDLGQTLIVGERGGYKLTFRCHSLEGLHGVKSYWRTSSTLDGW